MTLRHFKGDTMKEDVFDGFVSWMIMQEIFRMGWDMAVEHYKAMEEEEFGSYIEPGITAEEAFSKKLKEMETKIKIEFKDDDGEPQ
jgi:hypothetical protein